MPQNLLKKDLLLITIRRFIIKKLSYKNRVDYKQQECADNFNTQQIKQAIRKKKIAALLINSLKIITSFFINRDQSKEKE